MRWAWLVIVVGCGFAPRVTSVAPGDAVDAPPDEMPDASCKSTCADPDTLLECSTNTQIACPLGCHADGVAGDRCSFPVPSNGATVGDLGPHDLVISNDATMNTTTGEIREDASAIILRTGGFGISPEGLAYTMLGTDRGVLGVRGFAIKPGITLRASGSLVLIVLASRDITIEGTLDGSGGITPCGMATTNQCGGPGGGAGGPLDTNGTGCSPGKPGFDGTNDETGGGGGGYGNPAGGNGGDATNLGGVGGAGNCSTTTLVPIAGGSGGGGGGGGTGGSGGGGGGAIQLTALGHLLVHTNGTAMLASVRANGAGGKAGQTGQGGGGGGSAGGILLEGQTVVIDHALLVANAGGGGAGDGGSDGNPGRLDLSPAAGGTGGKPGGQGGAKNGSPANGTGPGDGTGGGGGGVGRIFINAGDMQYMVINGSLVSPTEYHATAQSM